MLHLTLRQLRVFESVARHLNFSRAAEELHLSQPAVSMQVHQLEENVGLPVFEQMGKRIYLTDAGKELYQYSRAIAQQLTELEESLNRMKGLEQGSLKVSVVSTANYFLPPVLAKFCQRHPGLKVNLSVGNRESVLRQLSENETDLAVIGKPPEGMNLVAEPFLPNPLAVIAPPDHALAKKRRIPLKALESERFLVREPGSGTRGAMERFFAQHKLKFTMGNEMSTAEAIKQGVQAGMGLAVVSLYTVELEVETGRLKVLDVQGFPIMREWYAVHREGKRLSKAADAFRTFLLKDVPRQIPAAAKA
jgi:LysR family transcriptional regulator, low CO2-responsive transcriptional regulator